MERLKQIANNTPNGNTDEREHLEQQLHELSTGFDYMGSKTCAADGMCATSCPVKSMYPKRFIYLSSPPILSECPY